MKSSCSGLGQQEARSTRFEKVRTSEGARAQELTATASHSTEASHVNLNETRQIPLQLNSAAEPREFSILPPESFCYFTCRF